MDKNSKEKLIVFLSDILEKSNISNFKYANFEGDNDINFIVMPKMDNNKLSEDVPLRLIIYCSDDQSLSIYCPLLYKLLDKDSLMFTLSAINKVNNRIAVGKIYLNDNNNSVISYIYRALFNNIYQDLTPELLNDYIDAFLLTSIEFYSAMKEVINENK